VTSEDQLTRLAPGVDDVLETIAVAGFAAPYVAHGAAVRRTFESRSERRAA
jgi:hypothetical protein